MKKKAGRRKRRPDEAFAAGPVQFARFGRVLVQQSTWTPEGHKDFRTRAPQHQRDIQKDVQTAIDQLLDLMRRYDPLCIVAGLFAANNLVDPEEYSEPTHEGREARVEYAHSLALALDTHGAEVPDVAIVVEASALIDRILYAIPWYFVLKAADPTQGAREDLDEAAFTMLLRYVFIRGSSMEQHERELIRELFQPHDALLVRRYGFTTDAFLAGITGIADSVMNAYNADLDAMAGMRDVHQAFCAAVENHPNHDLDTILRDLLAKPENKERVSVAQARFAGDGLKGFVVDSSTPPNPQILPLLAARFGDNKEFLTFPKAPGWPTNNTVISERPIVERSGNYYCPNVSLLMRQRFEILASLLRKADPAYFNKVFLRKRGKLLETLAFRYLGALLPGGGVYRNVFFRPNGPGTEPRLECDGLVLFDDRLFIVEAKAGELSLSARRGSTERLRANLSELIAKAHSQGLAARSYASDTPNAIFENADGSTALAMPAMSSFRGIYLVAATLADLSGIATRANVLSAGGLPQGREWPWFVFINDLRVISEVIESPAEFVLYLERRLHLNRLGMFSAYDELDYLGMFLKEGLYYAAGDAPDAHRFVPVGYTVEIERYYEHLAGRVTAGPRPRFRISEAFRDVIHAIQATTTLGRTHAAKTLLSFDGETQQKIENGIAGLRQLAAADGAAHHLTILSREADTTVVIAYLPPNALGEPHNTIRYCEAKRLQLERSELLCLFIRPFATGTEDLSFEIFDGPLRRENAGLVAMAERLRLKALSKFFAGGGKVERNDLCPCGSGQKFKRCCIGRLPDRP